MYIIIVYDHALILQPYFSQNMLEHQSIFFYHWCSRTSTTVDVLCLLHIFFVFFQSFRFHAQVFGRTLMHEFHFFYCHTEWNLLPLLSRDRLCYGWGVLFKLTTLILVMVSYLLLITAQRMICRFILSIICVVFIFQNVWMGNSFTASGSCDPGETADSLGLLL